MSKQSFHSHGKLLITGEYVVLDGVNALAVPTKKGQWLLVKENNTNQISWKSIDEKGVCWFTTNLHIENGHIVSAPEEDQEEDTIRQTLIDILTTAKELNPNFLLKKTGYSIETTLEFDRHWGLGASSTLINNIAQWAKVDAFVLQEKSFGGSGYDIACAQYDNPIIYKRIGSIPIIKEIPFNPQYKEHLFFIYLNQKQNSKEAIKHYQSLSLKNFDKAEAAINKITNNMLDCTSLTEFESLLNDHEQIISDIIKTPTLKSRLFPEYTGAIKSLGGWGGDFILATGTPSDMDHFRTKGYTTIIPYTEMVLEHIKQPS